ncbi:MAG: CbtA family protein, partial [Brachymonas sp.]|nr:CbtA family protein [Brachymonas sp.]
KYLAYIGFAAFISIVFAIMPPNPDAVTAPMDLVNGFRAMSFIAVSIFWISVGFILGMFWQKFRPENLVQSKIH